MNKLKLTLKHLDIPYITFDSREKTCKGWDQQGLNFQNVQIAQQLNNKNIRQLKNKQKGLPWGSLAKTPCSQLRGPGFDPWSRN